MGCHRSPAGPPGSGWFASWRRPRSPSGSAAGPSTSPPRWPQILRSRARGLRKGDPGVAAIDLHLKASSRELNARAGWIVVKRAFDLVVGGMALLVAAPPLLVL